MNDSHAVREIVVAADEQIDNREDITPGLNLAAILLTLGREQIMSLLCCFCIPEIVWPNASTITESLEEQDCVDNDFGRAETNDGKKSGSAIPPTMNEEISGTSYLLQIGGFKLKLSISV